MKVFTVVGARPQFIKSAVMSREFMKSNEINEIIVHTGQHFDRNMSEVFFDELAIPKPDYNLAIGGMSHGKMTGRMLEKLEELLFQEKPDVVLVYGDTNSTLAAALAASKVHIPVMHIEAGLRSYNMNMPEEINRIITDRLSTVLFCPTQIAVDNLRNEGYGKSNPAIINVGDIMLDASLFYEGKLADDEALKTDQFVLCTIHRAENTDDLKKLAIIVNSLNRLHKRINVILPLHPRTKDKLKEFGLNLKVSIIDPVTYFEMRNLIKNSSLVITDSGGLQKEAYFFKKKCVTVREQTEWVELIEVGANVLSPAEQDNIENDALSMIEKNVDFSTNLYGSGNASKKIFETILTF